MGVSVYGGRSSALNQIVACFVFLNVQHIAAGGNSPVSCRNLCRGSFTGYSTQPFPQTSTFRHVFSLWCSASSLEILFSIELTEAPKTFQLRLKSSLRLVFGFAKHTKKDIQVPCWAKFALPRFSTNNQNLSLSLHLPLSLASSLTFSRGLHVSHSVRQNSRFGDQPRVRSQIALIRHFLKTSALKKRDVIMANSIWDSVKRSGCSFP